jgi:hypothetical protein
MENDMEGMDSRAKEKLRTACNVLETTIAFSEGVKQMGRTSQAGDNWCEIPGIDRFQKDAKAALTALKKASGEKGGISKTDLLALETLVRGFTDSGPGNGVHDFVRSVCGRECDEGIQSVYRDDPAWATKSLAAGYVRDSFGTEVIHPIQANLDALRAMAAGDKSFSAEELGRQAGSGDLPTYSGPN